MKLKHWAILEIEKLNQHSGRIASGAFNIWLNITVFFNWWQSGGKDCEVLKPPFMPYRYHLTPQR